MLVRVRKAIHRGRYAAQMPDEFVLFLSGMRVNRAWKIHRWIWVLMAMRRMLLWLDRHPQAGLLNWHYAWINGPAVVQYWRSFADCERFARAAEEPHFPAWARFNKTVRASGEVGIWHETYQIRDGASESFYGNMPRVGLGLAGDHRPIGSSAQSAAQRIGAAERDSSN